MRGQALIEILVALGVGIILVTAITNLSVGSLNNSTFGNKQSQGTNYAQEGIEILRKIRNSDYTTFNAYNGNYCLNNAASVLSATPCVENAQGFLREIQVAKNIAECGNDTKVVVAVKWKSGRCNAGVYCHNVTLTSCFTNYTAVPAP